MDFVVGQKRRYDQSACFKETLKALKRHKYRWGIIFDASH